MNRQQLIRLVLEDYQHLDHNPRKKLHAIARDFGLEIYIEKLVGSCGGLLWKILNRWCIVLNSQVPTHEQTFAFAHELAHFVLHQSMADQLSYFPEQTESLERQANQLALKILLPKRALLPLCNPGSSIHQIASNLTLPSWVVRERLTHLRHPLRNSPSQESSPHLVKQSK